MTRCHERLLRALPRIGLHCWHRDLCVFRGATNVGSSGSGTSAEEVNLLNPTAAGDTVVVQGWGVAGSTPFKLHTWLLGSTDAGNLSASAPAAGVTGSIDFSFPGLTSATKYLGSVACGGVAGMPNPTIVRVDAPQGLTDASLTRRSGTSRERGPAAAGPRISSRV